MWTARARRQLRLLGWFVGIAAAFGIALNLLTQEVSRDSAGQGAIDGVLVAIVLGGYLLFVYDGVLRHWFQRWTFTRNLLANGAILAVLYMLARAFGQLVTSGPSRFWASFTDPHLAWALPLSALVVTLLMFTLQVNRMIGTNVLGYFLAGRYHRPREEERIFLFLDLMGSTQLAERLGSSAYYELLRRFVDDLSEPILATGGEIYQYAGDEVVITWRWDRGIQDASCVRCFFEIEDAIRAHAAAYQRDFGVVPRFRAGMHGGKVIGAEIGDLKREIVFTGDVLNTAARLEEYAKELKEQVLVAAAPLVDALDLPADLRAEFAAELQPRGKHERVGVYRLSRA